MATGLSKAKEGNQLSVSYRDPPKVLQRQPLTNRGGGGEKGLISASAVSHWRTVWYMGQRATDLMITRVAFL